MAIDKTIHAHYFDHGAKRIFYLAAGPENGPLVIFVHGWPELSYSWRQQLPAFAALGYRAIAPDMRGYGRSTVYHRHEDYAQEHIVGDMLALLEHLESRQAVWVGHDWGSPTVWSIASHHPQCAAGVVNLCVPYAVLDQGLDTLIGLVDREIYPIDQYPAGQWDYQCYYLENFERATQVFDAKPENTLKALFRRGSQAGIGKPAMTATIRAEGGWFGGADVAPELPLDTGVMLQDDLAVYVKYLTKNSFFGPDSYYMNHQRNMEFASRARNKGRIDLPTLFLAARYDFVCETIDSRLAEPMRARCKNLTEVIINSGHWMAQEKPTEVTAAIVGWMQQSLEYFTPKDSSRD